MQPAKQTVLRFILHSKEPFTRVMERFFPTGKHVLNRTAWRGKEPRSCSVTNIRSAPVALRSEGDMTYEVEVSYRPKGFISFVGNTKYDGWTAMLLNKAPDGTLLNESGEPLAEGHAPVYRPVEVYDDLDFNVLDFGEFIGEFAVEGVRHLHWSDVMQQVDQSNGFRRFGLLSTFMAPRRDRPSVKIVISTGPTGNRRDGWGTKILVVSNSTPHLQQTLLDHLTEVVCGLLEGRYTLNCIETADLFLVELTDLLVDCTPNAEGRESRFDCLPEYLPPGYLDELAQRLMATYEIEVDIVEGEKIGLLLRHVPRQ